MSFAILDLSPGLVAFEALFDSAKEMEKKSRIAGSIALTKSAEVGQQAVKLAMPKVFDRPTPWTLNATYVRPATKTQAEAAVGIKDPSINNVDFSVIQGNPESHLVPQILGGSRQPKRHEQRLMNARILPKGWRVIPGEGASIDQYGNQRGSEILKILSYLEATIDPQQRSTPKTRARKRRLQGEAYIVALPNNPRTKHLQPGVYKKTFPTSRGKLTPVMIFVKDTQYTQRLDFYGITERAFAQNVDELFELAYQWMQEPKGTPLPPELQTEFVRRRAV